MRPLIALLLSAAILLGVRAYLRFAESLRRPQASVVEEIVAYGKFSAEITLTFDAAADEFSLEPISLVFKQQDRVLLERRDPVRAGEPLVIENLTGIIAGRNEFYFECTPSPADQPLARAVRVRLFRDGAEVADTTLWAPPGQTPRGRITLDVPAAAATKESHEHAA
jgi:hypothetical protein